VTADEAVLNKKYEKRGPNGVEISDVHITENVTDYKSFTAASCPVQ
jgi:hypothetical protein